MSPKTPLSFRKSGCGRQLGEKAEDFLRQSIALNFGRSAATATESSHRNAQLVNRSNLIDHEIDVSRDRDCEKSQKSPPYARRSAAVREGLHFPL
jgi:hypothetical protein